MSTSSTFTQKSIRLLLCILLIMTGFSGIIATPAQADESAAIPEIEIYGKGLLIGSGDASPGTVDGSNFGAVEVGNSTSSTFELVAYEYPVNLTSAPDCVMITGPDAEDFSVISQPASPVEAGSCVSFQIEFNPSSSGVKNATVEIANDRNSVYTFDLRGTAQTLLLTNTTPGNGESGIPVTASITAGFNEELNAGTVSADSVIVESELSGPVTGSYAVSENTFTFTPDADFSYDDTVTVTVTTEIESAEGLALYETCTFQFNTEPDVTEEEADAVDTDTTGIAGSDDASEETDTGSEDPFDTPDETAGNDRYGYLPPESTDPPVINSTLPFVNAIDVEADSLITVMFDQTIDNSTVTADTYNVDGSISGKITGTFDSTQDSSVTFTPDASFECGETVTVTLTTGIESTNSDALEYPYTFQFTVEVAQGYGYFEDSGQGLSSVYSYDIVLGDVNGDGYNDALIANNGANTVWYNDGSGILTDSGQSLGSVMSFDIDLGDVDGDGDLDAFIAEYKYTGQANTVWLNNGSGVFTDSGQTHGTYKSHDVSLGDVDGDGDLDAFVANDGANKVWINDGSGTFSDSGQSLGSSYGTGISLGDLDGDGDLDAFVSNYDEANRVWLNDGSGNYSDSGLSLGSFSGNAVSLGDIDGDGDLDAFVANDGANKVWSNNGSGAFTDSAQSLGSSNSQDIILCDIDADGDLDAFVVNWSGQSDKIWINNGSGTFSYSLSLGSSSSFCAAVGDVDNDGDLDIAVPNYSQPGKVWLNVPQPLEMSSFMPSANTVDVGASSTITVDFNLTLDNSTVTANSFNVDGSISGKITGTFDTTEDNSVTFTPDNNFEYGETVTVTLTTGIKSSDGDALDFPYTYQFTVEAAQGYGYFEDSEQELGSATSYRVVLGDVDGDGDLDAFVANDSYQANKIWLNDGSGTFSDSGQSLGSSTSLGISLGDLDSDGDLDAFVANNSLPNKVWLNDGFGNFSDSGQSLGSFCSYGVVLGDVDGDGDLDAFVANYSVQANKVWLNDGSGIFADSGQSLGSSYSRDVSLGDLDSDGDLDAFVANDGQANKVWFNDGSGTFSDSEQFLGSGDSNGIALGDIDGDGDIDAVVANFNNTANEVWLNNGSGIFADSGQSLGSSSSYRVSLGDVNGDGARDAFVANNGANKVWINEGSGTFTDSELELGSSASWCVSLGDVDGDGDLDAFTANYYTANRVWLNIPPEPEISIEGNSIEIADGDETPSADDHTDFGETDIDDGSVDRTFTIKNTGDGELKLTGDPLVSITGTDATDFSVKTAPESPIAATTGETTFTITFDPTESGEKTATISIVNGDADENPYTFSICGTGIAKPEVTVTDATGIELDGATLNGMLDSLGTASSVDVQFEYGLTDSYGSTTTAEEMTETGDITAVINDLQQGTTYHCRIKAVGDGTGYSGDMIFTTNVDVTMTVIMEGGNRTESGYNVPLTFKLFDNETVLDSSNVLTETASYEFSTTDSTIEFVECDIPTRTATFTVKNVVPGEYKATVVTMGCLVNMRPVELSNTSFEIDMGEMLGGNVNNDTIISGSDFSMLLNDYLATDTRDSWNEGRCDFDKDGQVTGLDYSIMATNYSKTSPQAISR